jgi:L-threonylcarbamoyladenylate synthase
VKVVSNFGDSEIRSAASLLKLGGLVAFPTETVYGLGADSQNKDAVARLFKVKGRPKNHPVIVHVSSHNKLLDWACNIPDYAIKLSEIYWPGPLTMIFNRTRIAKDFITGGQDCVGLRVPSHPQSLKLIQEFEAQGGRGLAAPSANRFGKVSPTSAQDVIDELGNILLTKDILLDGGRCAIGLESTILDCRNKIPKIIRPGALSQSLIESTIGINVQLIEIGYQIRASGILNNHYSPNAGVFLSGNASKGDGFIALSKFVTPFGAIRLAAPKDNTEFAQQLYRALRKADQLLLKQVFVIPAEGDDLAIAINDRLHRASRR